MKTYRWIAIIALMIATSGCSKTSDTPITEGTPRVVSQNYAIIEGGFRCDKATYPFSQDVPFGKETVVVCSRGELTGSQASSIVASTFEPSNLSSPTWSCGSDAHCPSGAICEESVNTCSDSKKTERVCMTGCRDTSDCKSNESCNEVICDTCPCPNRCQPTSTTCKSDSDCEKGTVCESAQPGVCDSAEKKCIPGCRDNSGCNVGQQCNEVICDTCPCPNLCGSATSSGEEK